MGRFLISRTANGVRFSLVGDAGRTIAVSRDYATADACKKGIQSVIRNAPTVPIVDRTSGGYGANPKIEIAAAGDKLCYVLRSANGKAVLTSTPFASRKACLRAVSMLRRGAATYEIYYTRNASLVPVTITALADVPPLSPKPKTDEADGTRPAAPVEAATPDRPAPETVQEENTEDLAFFAEDAATDPAPAPIKPSTSVPEASPKPSAPASSAPGPASERPARAAPAAQMIRAPRESGESRPVIHYVTPRTGTSAKPAPRTPAPAENPVKPAEKKGIFGKIFGTRTKT